MSKRTIRRGVFETNSSSTHSITLCTSEDYEKWKLGEMIFERWADALIPAEDMKKLYEHDKDKGYEGTFEDWLHEDGEYMTYDDYDDNYDYEHFRRKFTTPSGEEVIAFGFYGYDS